ncbi:MAG: transposase [Phycisphaeraceae bacterium]|nr:transposase [Phycisphaeraceae bacterium]
MPRRARIQPGGYVFHVLNRGNGRMTLFEKPADYTAFEAVMAEASDKAAIRLLAYCLMPNHWHLVLWPQSSGDLGRYMQRLTTMHVRRWHEHRHSAGLGHLYQGPYKSFPIETDRHLLAVCRYVERNALRAELVERAENWRWGSMWRRDHSDVLEGVPPLTDWPVPRPRQWRRLVNLPQTAEELERIHESIRRGRPFGGETWQRRTAHALDLESTFRPRGRPKK